MYSSLKDNALCESKYLFIYFTLNATLQLLATGLAGCSRCSKLINTSCQTQTSQSLVSTSN